MDRNNFLLPFLTLILGGGIAGATLNLVRAKNENKKAPAERDAVIVTSAESAVVIMQKVLDATNTQLRQKQSEVEELSGKLVILKTELRQIKERCEEMEELLSLFMAEHPNTPKPD